MRRWRAAAVAAVSLIVPSTFASCSSTSGPAPPRSIPSGWKSYTFGEAEISVPADWTIHRTYKCIDRSAPGTLQLGRRPTDLSDCETVFRNANTVTLSSPPPASYLKRPFFCPAMKLNGLEVDVGPCGTSDPAAIVEYVAPSLGVEAVGTGTVKEDVTGSGAGTIVGRVLHTLRKA